MDKPPHFFLEFPLNVYAHCIYLRHGQVDYLHYGLVEPFENAWEIGALLPQERSTALILEHLPPPPCRILEIGVGLGTTAAKLAQLGYQVTALCPDSQQIAIARTRTQGQVALYCQRFEDFQTIEESFDVILLQESAQYFNTLALFNRLHALLAEHGQVLLVDEIGLRRTRKDVEGLPLLDYFLGQAQRCGFKLTKKIDLSTKAHPTLIFLLEAIATYKTTLLADLPINAELLDNLEKNLLLYQEKYTDGRYGYLLLQFTKAATPRWKITAVTSADQNAALDLFQEVFGYSMPSAQWTWKYQHGMGTAAWRNGKMVAHYGGIKRAIRYFGELEYALQIADVMVAQTERGVLTRKSPYYLVGKTFPELFAGYGSPLLLGFGFPTAQAMQTAEKMKLYAEAGEIVEIFWKSQASYPHWKTRIRHLNLSVEQDKKIIDELWEKMYPDFSQAIICIRDSAYINYRYWQHPQKKYEYLLVTHRFTQQPIGVVIISKDAEVCKILDIIAPLDAIPVLIQQVRRMAGNWNIPAVTLWITKNFSHLFTAIEGQVFPQEPRIPHCICYAGPPLEEVKDKWWLMGGDTDFL